MIKLLAISTVLLSCTVQANKNADMNTTEAATTISTTKSIYDFKVEALDGSTIDFSTFKGKKILIVNTASECGYTPQYEGLQKL